MSTVSPTRLRRAPVLCRGKTSRSPQLISFESKRLAVNIEVLYKATLNSLRRPLSGLRGLGGLSPETMPGSFDVSFGGPVAPRPCLGGGRGVFRDIIPNDRAGRAMNQS